jgi:hypothetical protein
MHKSNPFLKKSVEEVIPETWWVESQGWPPYALLTLAAMTGGVRRRWKGRTYTPLGGTCGTSQYCAFNVYGDLPYWNGSIVYEKSWRKVGKELPKHVFNRTPHVFFSLSLSEDETPSQDILNILRSMLAHQSSRRIDAGKAAAQLSQASCIEGRKGVQIEFGKFPASLPLCWLQYAHLLQSLQNRPYLLKTASLSAPHQYRSPLCPIILGRSVKLFSLDIVKTSRKSRIWRV